MAGGAIYLGVCAKQCKSGLLGVIESPHRPAVGGVTALTLLAQASFVHIIMAVAGDAGARRVGVGERGVALRAADQAVHPEQRIVAQIVIKDHLAAPGILPVTVFAAAGELAAVRVFTPVTARAVFSKLLRGHRRCVAAVTTYFGVRTDEREFVARSVIIAT